MAEDKIEVERQKPSKFLKAVEAFNKFADENYRPLWKLTIGLGLLQVWVTGRMADIQKGERVVEVSSGYPFYEAYANQVGKEGVFVAIDINPTTQTRARKIACFVDKIRDKVGRPGPGSHQVAADNKRLPLENNSFDLVIASTALGFDRSEAFRILKPGGRLVWSFEEVFALPVVTTSEKKLLAKTGFVDIETKIGTPNLPAMWTKYLIARKPLEITRGYIHN